MKNSTSGSRFQFVKEKTLPGEQGLRKVHRKALIRTGKPMRIHDVIILAVAQAEKLSAHFRR
jgi:hypothetical protein